MCEFKCVCVSMAFRGLCGFHCDKVIQFVGTNTAGYVFIDQWKEIIGSKQLISWWSIITGCLVTNITTIPDRCLATCQMNACRSQLIDFFCAFNLVSRLMNLPLRACLYKQRSSCNWLLVNHCLLFIYIYIYIFIVAFLLNSPFLQTYHKQIRFTWHKVTDSWFPKA